MLPVAASKCFLLLRTVGRCNFSFGRFYSDMVRIGPSHATQDFLLQNLKNAQSTNKVFELVNLHSDIMNKNHLMQALRTLFTLQKHGMSEGSTQKILKHPDFEKLCTGLRRHSGLIELNETIDALKIVSFVGVSSQSTIVQILLQLLKHNINELSLQRIMFVDFLLSQFQRTPLIEALLIALPIVFEINLPLKIHRHDLNHLAEYLQYVSKKNVSEKCVDLIVSSIMSYNGEIDTKSALSIVWSITDMKQDSFFEPLLKKALNVLTLDINYLSYDELETTITKLVNKFTPDMPFYYNETFFDMCAQFVVEKDLGFDPAVYVLKKFCQMYHMNPYLIDYLAEKALENNNLILNGSASHLCSFIIGLAMSEYRPKKWDILKQLIERTEVFSTDIGRKVLWLKLTSSLCALDIYKPEVLRKTFQYDFIQHVLKKRYRTDIENIIQIYQALSIFKPEYLCYLPQQDIIETVLSRIREPQVYSLENCLKTALGGEKYVKNGLRTRQGHFIDHILMFRKGGFPVPFNNEQFETKYIENFEFSDHQLVLVLALGPPYFTVNGNRMKGATALMITTLESKGYPIVPINLKLWESLPDFERIPYIMQEIKSKINMTCSNEGVV